MSLEVFLVERKKSKHATVRPHQLICKSLTGTTFWETSRVVVVVVVVVVVGVAPRRWSARAQNCLIRPARPDHTTFCTCIKFRGPVSPTCCQIYRYLTVFFMSFVPVDGIVSTTKPTKFICIPFTMCTISYAFHSQCAPFHMHSIQVVHHFICIPFTLCTISYAFHSSCAPFHMHCIQVVHHFICIPFTLYVLPSHLSAVYLTNNIYCESPSDKTSFQPRLPSK